jgi:2-polyprenyl-3-methyl-5-hydroxy-6-metoxy-1,4-benzoquinol methylase
MTTHKKEVFYFWNNASCGEDLYLHNTQAQGYVEQARMRYHLEPYIFDFANFSESKSKCVLEVGVGLGADHQQFAQASAEIFGVDLTARAVEHTQQR